MADALKRCLEIDLAEATAFVADNGGALKAARKALESGMMTGKSKTKRDMLRKVARQCQLDKWATASNHPAVAEFLSEASLLELDVTLLHNPTYPFLAFKVPLQACIELAKDYVRVPIAPESLAYALVLQHLQNNKRITKSQARALIASHNLGAILANRDIVELRPFPANVLDGHPLASAGDMKQMAPGEAMLLAPGRGTAALREAREMRNRIMKIPASFRENGPVTEEYYQIDEGAGDFVRAIRELLTQPIPGQKKTTRTEEQEPRKPKRTRATASAPPTRPDTPTLPWMDPNDIQLPTAPTPYTSSATVSTFPRYPQYAPSTYPLSAMKKGKE